jgi:O-antigen/teichoic acid export membrane protein
LDALLLAGLSVSVLIVEYLRRTFILFSSHALLWLTDLTRYGLLAVTFATISLNHLELVPQTYVLLFAACNVVAAVIASLARLFQSRGRIDWSRSQSYFPRLLGGGKWLSLSAIMSFVVDNLLVLIASATLGPFAIGIVRACQTIVGLLNPVFTALENMVPKWLGAQIYENGMQSALRKYARVAGGIYLVGATALLVIAVLADPVLTVFAGPDSAGYGWILQVLCLGTSAVLGSLLTAFIFRAWEQTRPIFFSYLTACTSTFVVGTPLMLSFGMLGVVLGMLLAPIINFLALQSLFWMELRKRSQSSIVSERGAAEHA